MFANSLGGKKTSRLSTKVSRAVGSLKHKTFQPQETLKTLYTGIVEPHLILALFRVVLAQMSITSCKNFEPRIVTNSSFDTPSRTLTGKAGCEPFQDSWLLSLKTLVFKPLHPQGPQHLCGLFTCNSNFVLPARLSQKQSSNRRSVCPTEKLECGIRFLLTHLPSKPLNNPFTTWLFLLYFSHSSHKP